MSVTRPIAEDLAQELAPDYEIVAELGRGGVSVVYLARERELGREVAIKVIRDLYTQDGESVARFEREARMLARLQHPNIVTLYTAKRLPGGGLALVMQYGAWQTLKAAVAEQGPMPADTVESVLRDIAGALVYLHRHDVIHRDIKPENIFLDLETGRALLSDFGLAKPGGNAHENVTLAGVVIGTPAYMSPEQIDGGALDGQSDVYSLGMVGYEMLTGRRPWAGESLYNVIYKQKHEQLPPLQEVRPDAPEALCRAIHAAIEKDRTERLPSVEALLGQLSGAGAAPPRRPLVPALAISPARREPVESPTMELELIAAELQTAGPPRWRRGMRHRAMIAAPLVLVLLAGVGAAAVALNSEPVEPQAGAGTERSVLPPAAAQAPIGLTAGVSAAAPPAEDPTALADDSEAESYAGAVPESRPAPRAEEAAPPAETPSSSRAQPQPAAREQTEAESSAEAERDSQLAALARAPIAVRTSRPAASPDPATPSAALLDRVTVAERIEAPSLRNPATVAQALLNAYPARLKRLGIGGLVEVSVLVGPTGLALESKITGSSGDPQLDAAALQVARKMDFVPGKRQGMPAALWARIPLVFQVDQRED